MSPMEMITSEAVAVTFGNRVLGFMAWLMPLSVTISTFGSANGTLFAAGRLCFAASREGHLLDILSYVHVRRYTPAPGLIFHVSKMVFLFFHRKNHKNEIKIFAYLINIKIGLNGPIRKNHWNYVE